MDIFSQPNVVTLDDTIDIDVDIDEHEIIHVENDETTENTDTSNNNNPPLTVRIPQSLPELIQDIHHIKTQDVLQELR